MGEINRRMYLFTIKDMQYQDYRWTDYAEDDSRISGFPDKTPFDRNEGQQMLYMINEMASVWHLKQVGSCAKMERIIREALPQKLRKQEVIMEWVRKNWDRI